MPAKDWKMSAGRHFKDYVNVGCIGARSVSSGPAMLAPGFAKMEPVEILRTWRAAMRHLYAEVRQEKFSGSFLRKDVGAPAKAALQTQLSAGIAARVKWCKHKRGTK